jgi:CspA family cold shock protein
MTEGTVKFFNGMRNFGFITGEDGKEYFVHGSAVKEGTALKEGDKVSFKGVQGDRGMKAEGVEKLE